MLLGVGIATSFLQSLPHNDMVSIHKQRGGAAATLTQLERATVRRDAGAFPAARSYITAYWVLLRQNRPSG